jgi:hypothetical protein
VDTYVLLGSTSGSHRAGSAEHDWHLKVYRHPELQAMTTDYNFGHDIYALGVCLLEIGLWTALVLPPAANSKVQVASKKLLSAGGVVLVDRLEKELKEALNSQPEGMVLSALKEAACSTVASLLLEKVLDMLGVDGNNEPTLSRSLEMRQPDAEKRELRMPRSQVSHVPRGLLRRHRLQDNGAGGCLHHPGGGDCGAATAGESGSVAALKRNK